jgi:Uncharacterized protein conserved in bacteria (DUF2184)
MIALKQDFEILKKRAGILFLGSNPIDFQGSEPANEVAFAIDSQPTLVTSSNAGIPAFLSTYIDPKLIEILVSPMKAAEVVGAEVKKGDWTTETAMFDVVESTGEVSSYGDYSENGIAGVNVNFPQRQSYTYQVITQWGERQLERAGLARIDWANRVNIASALTLNKFQNKSYFFGVSGLQNYGLLNDPQLPAAITPTTKDAGGTSWNDATALEVFADIKKLYKQLQTQANGLVELDSPMTLAMSPESEVGLTYTTEFNVNVSDIIKKNFPNMTVKTAPEYTTNSGELVQLMLDTAEGQRTAEVGFTEKMRAHPIVVQTSSFKQKKSQGTWGCIIYRPVFIAQMLGV